MPRSKGFKHSRETKDKIRLSLMGHSVSGETRERISKALKGREVWNRGKPWPDEIKGKISETNKAKGIEPKVKYIGKGINSYRWKGGRPKCVDCGKQLRSYNAKRCNGCSCKGDRAYNWKGGVRTKHQKVRGSIEFRMWRKAVFARDNWTCQKMGIKGNRLHPHHIYDFSSYPELRFAIDNGITLSKEAHIEFHKRYGKNDNTREQLEEFLKES